MLILASASPSRRQMLANVGLDFTIEPSGVVFEQNGEKIRRPLGQH